MSAVLAQSLTDQVAVVLNKELVEEGGASAAEYALILAIVGAAIAGALILLRGNIITAVDNAANRIPH